MQILVATGGATHSDTAVTLGAHIAKRTHSTLTLLTVMRHEDDKVQANAILTRATAMAARQAVNAKKCLRTGQVATEIADEASRGQYDLVVIGERQEHSLVTRLMGATVDRVIAQMPCPVLIARPKTQELNHLLLCEGGREPSLLDRFVGRLTPLIESANELTVLHVMSQMVAAPGVPGWELRAEADELIAQHTLEGTLLEHDAATISRLPVHLETKIRHGLIVEEILSEANDGDYDLIVIGAHQGSAWERFLLDDLAHQIVTQSNNSILII